MRPMRWVKGERCVEATLRPYAGSEAGARRRWGIERSVLLLEDKMYPGRGTRMIVKTWRGCMRAHTLIAKHASPRYPNSAASCLRLTGADPNGTVKQDRVSPTVRGRSCSSFRGVRGARLSRASRVRLSSASGTCLASSSGACLANSSSPCSRTPPARASRTPPARACARFWNRLRNPAPTRLEWEAGVPPPALPRVEE
jgi:hypothetical protein